MAPWAGITRVFSSCHKRRDAYASSWARLRLTPLSLTSRWAARAAVPAALFFLVTATAEAHGVSDRDGRFLQSLDGAAIGPLLYLGAKHMVTGYDHLLFLVGVVFFLYKLRDIFLYVSLFTVGHSVTLLIGALGGVRANPYIIDAIIGLSIVYKAFENLGGFRRMLGFQPEHQGGRARLRPVSRIRPGDEAARLPVIAERPRHEHRELQHRGRNRPGAGPVDGPDRLRLLARYRARSSDTPFSRTRCS